MADLCISTSRESCLQRFIASTCRLESARFGNSSCHRTRREWRILGPSYSHQTPRPVCMDTIACWPICIWWKGWSKIRTSFPAQGSSVYPIAPMPGISGRLGRHSSLELTRSGRGRRTLLAAANHSMARSSGFRTATSGPVCSRTRWWLNSEIPMATVTTICTSHAKRMFGCANSRWPENSPNSAVLEYRPQSMRLRAVLWAERIMEELDLRLRGDRFPK